MTCKERAAFRESAGAFVTGAQTGRGLQLQKRMAEGSWDEWRVRRGDKVM